MSGKDNPSPTPAPQIIAPIKTISNTSSLNLFFTLKIPENVSLDFGRILKERANATAGKQYIAHAVNDQ